MKELNLFWTALMFYSRLPAPSNLPFSNAMLNRSRKYFPLIGLIVASIGVIVLALSAYLLPIEVAVLLSMVATILVTGAFHEDGFCDSCDGLGGGQNVEQILHIMKDSRIGTYGCVGIILLLAAKFLALLSIAQVNIATCCLAMLTAHTLSRVFASLVIDYFDYVQDTNASKVKPITDRSMGGSDWGQSILMILPPLAILIYTLPWAILTVPVAIITSYSFAIFCRNKIGGYTGDTLGATQQLSEVSIYLVLTSILS